MASKPDFFMGGVIGAVVTAAGFILVPSIFNEDTLNMIPMSRRIQEGFADPNKIEMFLEDPDKDGKNEHIFQYDGVNYLLKIDKQERPYFQSYSVKPAEKPKIIPGSYDSRGLEKSVSGKGKK